MASEPGSLAEVLEKVPQKASSAQIKNINATIQIRSTGAEPGEWVIAVKDGAAEVGTGVTAAPTLTVEATSDVWLSLIRKQLDPTWAYMSGKLRVTGDLDLAMRLQSLISLA